MKDKSHIFTAYFMKAVSSPMFLAGVFGTAAICLSNFLNGIYGDLYTQMLLITDFTMLRRVITVFCSLPFAANFAEEWQSGASTHYISRCGVKKYLASNIAVNFLVSTLCVFAGMMIFFIAYSDFAPVYVPESGGLAELDAALINSGFPFLFVIVKSLVFALSCGMWSTLGLMLSAFLPNKHIAICSPLVASYVVERLTMDLPARFNLMAISVCRADTGTAGIIYCVAILFILSAIFGAGFIFRAKRRIG